MAKKKPPTKGEVRIGVAGNKYNKWNGKRWVPVSAARTGAGSGQKSTRTTSKVPKRTGSYTPTSSGPVRGKQQPGVADDFRRWVAGLTVGTPGRTSRQDPRSKNRPGYKG